MSLKPKYSIYIALIVTVQNQPEPRMKQGPGRSRQEADNEAANFKAPAAGDFTLIITHHDCRGLCHQHVGQPGEFSPQIASSITEDLLFIVQLASS